MWGRLVTFRHVQTPDETGSGPDTRDLSASGRRIGLAAVCLAIVIPVIVPTMHAHHLFGTTGARGTGSGTTAGVSPLLTVGPLLESKPKPVLTYTTEAPDPRQQYFQVYVLNYNARHNLWLQLPHSRNHPLTGPPTGELPWKALGLVDTTPVLRVRTRVHMSKDYSGPSVLPIPYAPTQLDLGGDSVGWQASSDSLMVFNNGLNLAGLSYTVQSTEPNPRPANIPNLRVPLSIQAQYGSYHGPDRAQLREIARKRTVGATTPLQRAQDLENWFQSDFSYSLRPGLPVTNWLPTFLTTDQRGFCSQFAWAFAVLARLVGIPSRIAVGYTGGLPAPGSTGTWQVTTADAHAWPELYFSGEGWLRLEPTPTGSLGQRTAADPGYAGGDNTFPSHKPNPAAGPTSQAGSLPAARKHLAAPGLDHGVGGGLTARRQSAGSDLWLAIGIPAGVFLLIAWPALTRVLTRRRRWLSASSDRDLAHAAWRELTDDLADYGLGFTQAETPRAVARRVTREADLDESGIQAVIRISAAEERARYARLPDPGADLKGSARTARLAISASVPRRQRLRARLLPASTLQAAGRLTQRASEMFNWLDFSWPAVRRQLRTTGQRPG
jgi:transglutaminase-like putative cysteine protease